LVLNEDTWVNALFNSYKPIDRRTIQDPDDSNINYPNWIVTDVRFPNEAKAIKDRGGLVIRINRRLGQTNNNIQSLLLNVENSHSSETALDDYAFDYTISNDSTIEELISIVKQLLIKEDLI